MYCGFNPSKSSIKNFTYVIGKPLDSYIGNCYNFLVDSDFNFCNWCDKATCCKNPENPSSIDLFLTYFPRCLQNILAIETVLCDFHRLVVIVLKIYLPNDQIITYRNYKHLDNKGFLKEFLWEFDSLGSLAKTAEMFQNLSISFLDKYAPEKQKYVRVTKLLLKILNLIMQLLSVENYDTTI